VPISGEEGLKMGDEVDVMLMVGSILVDERVEEDYVGQARSQAEVSGRHR
jgi:hypothetical protein